MNEPELQSLENELRKLSPAKLPPKLRQGLVEQRPCSNYRERNTPVAEGFDIWGFLRFGLLPAGAIAAAALALLVWHYTRTAPDKVATSPGERPALTSSVPGTAPGGTGPESANASQEALVIDHQLLSSYETIADVPEVGPVRFYCSHWIDKVVLRDPVRGIAIERRTPRVEVIPVRFESY